MIYKVPVDAKRKAFSRAVDTYGQEIELCRVHCSNIFQSSDVKKRLNPT